MAAKKRKRKKSTAKSTARKRAPKRKKAKKAKGHVPLAILKRRLLKLAKIVKARS